MFPWGGTSNNINFIHLNFVTVQIKKGDKVYHIERGDQMTQAKLAGVDFRVE